MLYEQEKREKTLPDSSSPDRTRLSTLSLSQRRRKMSPFALLCEEKPPHLWMHARRRLWGTLMAHPVTGVGELGGKAKREDTHTHTCTHASTQIQNTQARTAQSRKIWKYQIFILCKVKVTEIGIIKYIFLLSCIFLLSNNIFFLLCCSNIFN